ncbi:MAG TPA: APH(3') family aminoglycoside O-phosphotransferase [Chloroflexota bacterium]|jgi:kanamycin kinase
MTREDAALSPDAVIQEAPPIPAGALAGMENWEATLAWALVPERTTWRLQAPQGDVRYLKVSRHDQEHRLADERDRLIWAATRLPVPQVLAFGTDDEVEWLLTAGLPGVNAIDDRLRADPARLVPLLGEGLRRLHSVPIGDCPFDSRLDGALRLAQHRVATGLVDAGQDLHSDHGLHTAEAALARLMDMRPAEEDLVVCHGDFCLPNILLSDGHVSGYVDLGRLGVADRWWDLAVATWSVTWNLGPGWEDLFLEGYGIGWDHQKAAFYRLLYDLSP